MGSEMCIRDSSIPLTLAVVAVQVRASLARRASLALMPRSELRWARPAAAGVLAASLVTGVVVSMLWGQFRSPLVELSTMNFGLSSGETEPIPSRPTTLGLIGVSVLGAAFGSWLARARTPLLLGLAVLAVPALGGALPSLLAHTAAHPPIEVLLVTLGTATFLTAILRRFDRERPVLDLMQPRELFTPLKSKDYGVELDVPEVPRALNAEQARKVERLVSPTTSLQLLLVGIAVLLLICLGMDLLSAEEGQEFSILLWTAEAFVGPSGAFEEKLFGSGLFSFCLATLVVCFAALRTRALEAPLLYPYSRNDLYRLRLRGAWSLAWRSSLMIWLAGSAIGVGALWLCGLRWVPNVTYLMGALSIGMGIVPWLGMSWEWGRKGSGFSWGGFLPMILGVASGALTPKHRDWLAVPLNEVFLGLALAVPGWFLLSRILESKRTGDRSFA